ncbi:MAG: hypothetical protein U0704_03505 [Candidatus Eisenbacteria bacterium]
MRTRVGVPAIVLGLLLASQAHAGHHLWRFTEAFSNASGGVQFIEMHTADANEQAIGGFGITSNTGTFNFVTPLSTSATANTSILIATANFAALPGAVTPDYILPANFISTGGGTLNYAGGVHVWNHGALPTDGVHSLLFGGTTGVNSPKNFAGQTGSINLANAVPMVQTWGLVVLVGALLLLASGLLKRQDEATLA